MAKKRILALDPGGTCGWSIWVGTELEEMGQDPPAEFFKVLRRELERGIDVVVYERYVLRANASRAMIGSEFEVVQVIGVVRYLCKEAGVVCIGQMPAQRMFFTNERLKEMGVYRRGAPHALDSVRHGLYYLAFKEKVLDISGYQA